MSPLVALLSGHLTARAIPVVPVGQRRGANPHQPTDSGFGVPRFEGGDRFLAQVETIGGWHRQESKLFIHFNRPDLYTDCYNPIERLWRELKRDLAWMHFEDIVDVQQAITRWVNQLTPEAVRSLTKWDWIIDALCVAGI